jgi:hypothetical protein
MTNSSPRSHQSSVSTKWLSLWLGSFDLRQMHVYIKGKQENIRPEEIIGNKPMTHNL